MSAPHSFEFFNARLNAMFGVAGHEAVQLELCKVESSQHQGFSLFFRGPVEPLLPQMTYSLESPADGVLDIFLVPIARDKAGVQYEAVFS